MRIHFTFLPTLTFTFFILLLSHFASAQRTITGKVVDADNNEPLAAATVMLTGNTGVQTDKDGNFSLAIDNATPSFTISYAGYQRRVIMITRSLQQFYLVKLTAEKEQAVVAVIGSRNTGRTKLETPVPVDIMPLSSIAKETGQTDVNQLITYTAPSFQSTRQTTSDGSDHLDPAQLRGLGSDQLLVLVNGKRRHQSGLVNVNGTVNRGQASVDMNTIPVSAIDRIEILRDGAAAQYGSDAIAGVINIVLKKDADRLSGSVSYGANVTGYEKAYALNQLNHRGATEKKIYDGETSQANLNYGFHLGRQGYMNISGEYTLRNNSNRTGTYTGKVYANISDDSTLAARGLTRDHFDMRIGNSQMKTGAVFVNAGYALSDNWKLHVFGGYSRKNGVGSGIYRYPSAISTAAGTYADDILQLYPNGFLPLIKTEISDISISAELAGRLGKWNAALSNTFGQNNFDFNVDHSVNYTQAAVNRDLQTAFSAGGLRFLQNTVNADFSRQFDLLHGLNIAFGAEFRTDEFSQHAGEEASYKNYDNASGATAGAQVFAGFLPEYAKKHTRHNTGLYADIEQDLTRKWMVSFALRFENYSDFGATLNYKLATLYRLTDRISIRAATSSGFRAPSMQQKHYAKTNTIFVSTAAGLQPTESGTFTNDSRLAQILGIPALKEETSQNYSFGITASPVNGLTFTLDAYRIDIKDRIVLTNNFTGGTNAELTQLMKDNGATSANFFTNAIDMSSQGIEGVANYRIQAGRTGILRLTLAASYIHNRVKKGDDGKPAVKASPILAGSGQLGNYFNREDQSRMEVAMPSTKGNLTVNYSRKKISAMIRWVYFGKIEYVDPSIDPAAPDKFPVNDFTGARETLDQSFDAKTVTDVSITYAFSKTLSVTLGSSNVFDVYPDKNKHSGNVSLGRFVYSRRVQQMGFNGRYMFSRLLFNF